jgi:hypothetical protein
MSTAQRVTLFLAGITLLLGLVLVPTQGDCVKDTWPLIDAVKPLLVFVFALSILVLVGIEFAKRTFQFERKGKKLAPLHVFVWRLAFSAGLALAVILATLSVGMLFYYYLTPTNDPLRDRLAIAFHRASMILSGMGPVESEKFTNCERWFAGAYALFSGFVLVTVIGLILTPILHRALHHFHMD